MIPKAAISCALTDSRPASSSRRARARLTRSSPGPAPARIRSPGRWAKVPATS
jgi:hypothetical protein